MKQKKRIGLRNLLLGSAAIMAAGLLVANDANATNGYFAHAYSIKNKGMAGAGVAAPLDAMVPSINPAGLTEIGNRLDLGLTFFSPRREYNIDGSPSGFPGTSPLAPGTVESDSEYFFIPSIGWSHQLNDRSAVGIAVYGNGGMNTDYPPVGGFGTFGEPAGFLTDGTTGVDLMQLFIAPTLATKLAYNHSLGITPIIAAQFFEARGLNAFGSAFGCPPGFCVSSDDTKLTNNGHDSSLGFGMRVGYLGRITEQVSIGFSYQSKIYMDEFDDYAGLFAEQGDFDIPANWTAGIAVKPIPEVTVAFDVQRIYYSSVKSIANTFMPAMGMAFMGDPDSELGDDNGAGFGWDDMTVFKVGLQWARSDQWTYRFGYSYGDQPIDASEVMFNILAPGVIEQHATFGLTYTFANTSELDFSLTYALEEDVTGPNPFDPGQTITLTMNQWEVGLGYSWKF
jgi:long-chain fatty acid transport protein